MTETSHPAFMRPGKIVGMLLLGGLVYLVALVVMVPAGWLWHYLEPRVDLPPQVQVETVAGTLWQGRASLAADVLPLTLDWQLGLPLLSGLSLPVDLAVRSGASLIDGRVEAGLSGNLRFDGSGDIRVADFESLIERSGGAMLEGRVRVQQVTLVLDDQAVVQADGLADWPGGQVSWPMGGRRQQADFPPMQARMAGRDGDLALTIFEQGVTGAAARASVTPAGMMEIEVYHRLLELAGQRWSDAAQPDDVVFRVQQPLLGPSS